MVRAAVRLPAAVGVNVTRSVHLLFAATELPQVLVWVKSPGLAPVNPTPVIDKAKFPVLFSVTVWAGLGVPRFWLLNVRLVGAAPAKGALPVPVRLTVWGLLVALSAIVKEAVRAPGPVGVKVTLIVQVPPGATELPQVLVAAKSPAFVPVIWWLVMVKGAFPALFNVRVWDPLVDPTGRLA
jgi:hypothetical protein